MTRLAAIDCGTNSLRLLVADCTPGAVPEPVLRRTEIVRLGQGVDATGQLHPDALARVAVVLRAYAAQCVELGVEAVRFAATSAARDAANGADLLALVREVFPGVAAEILSGEQEARLTFAGAARAVRAAGHPAPYLVVDLGGGSTELVRGATDVEAACSLDIGSVRLTERVGGFTEAAVEPLERLVDAALDDAAQRVDLTGVHTLVGLAGTVTTLTAHALGLASYDNAAVHLAAAEPGEVLATAREFVAMDPQERAALPVMVPGRADVIAAGALVYARIVERVAEQSPGMRVVTSIDDILVGALADFADRR